MERNIRLDGMMGLVTGDALGSPVQFSSREAVRRRAQGPVTGMESGGVFRTPAGTWTDDSSMALAALDSINVRGEVDLDDIMEGFVSWYEEGKYTPFGEAFDIGGTCSQAILKYEREHDTMTCGGTSEHSNGNGSLMRIMPVCLYVYEKGLPEAEAVKTVHEVAGLTHNHLRAKIACGLYYFCVREILDGTGSLTERLQSGLDKGFTFYKQKVVNLTQLSYYARLRDLTAFAGVPESGIKSSGYVVDSLEAAIWSLICTDSFKDCLLKAVNLGDDADTVGAIAGGLAGLYYGYDAIPEDWLAVIQRREWIEGMC